MDQPGTTVSSVGIARLAGVGRAAVSNWRRRYADFPASVGGTATSPAFDLAAVEKWLSDQGKLPTVSGATRAWREIEAVSGGPDLGEALWLAGTWLLNRSIGPDLAPGDVEGDLPTPDRLIEPVARIDSSAGQLLRSGLSAAWSERQRAVLLAATKVDSDAESAEVFEELYRQYLSARGSTSDYTTPEGVARLMLSLAGRAKRVMDVACGSGTLLMEAINRGATNSDVRCLAQDIDATAARITQVRLLFASRQAAGVGSHHLVRVGDSLRVDAFPGQRVDLVVCNPPFGLHDWVGDQMAFDPRWEFGGLPPRTEPELAWVQDALAHLEPGGLAVLLMPPGAAWRSAGRRIRAELLRRGSLRAVIGLPPRLLPVTAVGLHLWLLRRPLEGESAGQVLLVDTTPTAGGGTPDLAAVTETAVRTWRAFDGGSTEFEELPGICRVLPVIELLDEDVDVSPARHLAVAENQEQDATALLAESDKLTKVLEALGQSLPALAEEGNSVLATARRVSLEELARTAGVMIHRGVPRSATDDEGTLLPAVTGIDIVRSASPSGRASPDGVRVESGDVLLPTIARSVVARVATPDQVGAQLGHSMNLVRADPQVLDPWYLAGVLSAPVNLREAARNSSMTRDSVRVNVKRLQVPLLPLAEQQRYGEAFRRLAEFDTMLSQAAERGQELARRLSQGLSSGMLAPAPTE